MAAFFTDREIAELTAMETSAMPDTATISRATTASDSRGGFTATYTTAATTVCRVLRVSGTPREMERGGKTVTVRVTPIYLPTGTDVRDGDRIIVSGTTFEVLTALAPQSYETARKVECVEVA